MVLGVDGSIQELFGESSTEKRGSLKTFQPFLRDYDRQISKILLLFEFVGQTVTI